LDGKGKVYTLKTTFFSLKIYQIRAWLTYNAADCTQSICKPGGYTGQYGTYPANDSNLLWVSVALIQVGVKVG